MLNLNMNDKASRRGTLEEIEKQTCKKMKTTSVRLGSGEKSIFGTFIKKRRRKERKKYGTETSTPRNKPYLPMRNGDVL